MQTRCRPLHDRVTVVPGSGRKPKLVFHGAKAVNDVIVGS